MTDNPHPPENKAASEAAGLVDETSSLILEITEGLIIADFPFLGYPGLKQLWEGFFEWFSGYLQIAAKKAVVSVVIDEQVHSEVGNLSEALAALIAAEKSGDKNAIQIAVQNYADAHSLLVNDDGSAAITH